jgi:hypothetical protein
MAWLTRHSFAATCHLIAFGALLGAAIDVQPLSDYVDQFWMQGLTLTTRRWYYKCAGGCDEDDRSFFVARPNNAVSIEGPFKTGLPGVASMYVLWSSVVHWMTYFELINPITSKWVDYVVTAPTMLSVIAVVFGSTSVSTVIISPIILALLLVSAGLVEPPVHDQQTIRRNRKMTRSWLRLSKDVSLKRVGIVAFLCIVHVLLWVPIFLAADKVSTEPDDDESPTPAVFLGVAPRTVILLFLTVRFESRACFL